jgi:hypothetical protein
MDVPYYTAGYDFVLAPSDEANGRGVGALEEARTEE